MAKYHTTDAKTIIYEVTKVIQCKQMLMDKHEHSFLWTGTKIPKITSQTMIFDKIVDGENGFKKAIFKFKKPLIFNSSSVAHIRMEIDDENQQSSTHIEHFVNEPIDMVGFNVQLPYKAKGNKVIPDAKILKKKIGDLALYEHHAIVLFNNKTASYEYTLYSPEVGYSFKLEWKR